MAAWFHRYLVLPCRDHGLVWGPISFVSRSRRVDHDFSAFITFSGDDSADTTTWTWLDRTLHAWSSQSRCSHTSWIVRSTTTRHGSLSVTGDCLSWLIRVCSSRRSGSTSGSPGVL